uniref:NADH dehydrogenase subunit 6 n=1 Tax=Nierstraszella lineata TaxID=515354 RepID=A0A6H1PG49_9MOLL|nr:NADH dehydrogenase subunit 6 [Nierstraszella lineata]QIZ12583.1 NADH dehydrogenase subunit 6 [Nierstraszella lineata]
MTMVLLCAHIMSFCTILPFLTQPISLGVNILIGVLSLSLCVVLFAGSWFAFILILVYLGGLLVVFAYMITLVPNVVFKTFRIAVLQMIFMVVYMCCILMLDMKSMLKGHMVENFPWVSNQNDTGLVITFSFNSVILISTAMVLLLALICVVKICFLKKGPLRPFL